MIDRDKLYNRLNKDRSNHDYIPVIETNEDFFMIWRGKVARCTKPVYDRRTLYIESEDDDGKKARFSKLTWMVEEDSKDYKGTWLDLKEFINKLSDEDIEFVEQSIKEYE